MDALTLTRGYGAPAPQRMRGTAPRLHGLERADGEQLALRATATAVALLPLLRPTGPANTAPLDFFILLVLGSCLLWAGRSGTRWRFPYVFPFSLFVLGGALGSLAGPVPMGGLIALLAWCICLANVCRSPRGLQVVLRTWVWSAMAWAIVLLIGEFTGNAYLAGIQSWEGGRTSLTFGDPNYCAYYFFVAMMMIAATRYPRRRRTRVLMYLILLPTWALSGSNGAIVELLLALALIAVIAVHREHGATLAISAACMLLAFGAVAVPRIPFARIQRAAHDSQYRLLRDWLGRSEKTFGQRKQLDHEGIDLFLNGGPLGEGPTSTIHRLTATQAPFAREAHNDYLAALTERGFIGAAGLMLLLGGVLTRAASLVRARLSPAFTEVVPRAGPLVAAVAGTFVFSTVYEVLHARDVWALFAVVAALSLWGRE
jgi:hypothetical protein